MVLGLSIASSLVSAPARAAAVVTDWAALTSAFAAGGEIVLGADVTAPASGSLAVAGGGSVELDLRGHALTITSPGPRSPAIGVPADAHLVVDDTITDALSNALTVTGGNFAAGIGGNGLDGRSGAITIQGAATVVATAGTFSAGIGGASDGSVGPIAIGGTAVVTATGINFASGIGGGYRSSGGDLTITDQSTVTATGGARGAGIGGGYQGGGGTLRTHDSSTVTATGGFNGAGIGGGEAGPGGTVASTGTSSVSAYGGSAAAGIGGGLGSGGGSVSTSGSSTLTAVGGAAGIGGGADGAGGVLTTSGTSAVSATGGAASAGIGGSGIGAGGTVRLRGSGPVSAASGSEAPAVGGGAAGAGASVSVNATADLRVSGGIAFGPGTDAVTWGSLTNAGTITLADGTAMVIPAGATVTNSGTITNHGSIQGAGTIANSGRITGPGTVANDGQGGAGTTVTTHSYRLTYDYGGIGTAPPPVTVLAATAADGGRALDSAPGDDDHVFVGWYTAATGGTQVTGTTDLPDLLGDGPLVATLYARYDLVQRVAFSSSAPIDAVLGESYTPATTGGDSAEPVTLSIDPATTNGACTLVDDRVELRHAGVCVVAADQAGAPGYAAAETATQSFDVRPAATTLALGVTGTALTATVSSTVPGPAGSVTFSVDGTPVGSADLIDGVARVEYVVPSGQAHTVTATYAGQGDHAGSGDVLTRRDPALTAAISSPANAAGWHRSPVTISFTCQPNGAPLTTPCPGSLTLGSGAGQSVSRSVAAADGGTATATVAGISVDLEMPTAKPVRKGKRVRCVATDALSGVASCRVSQVKKLRAGKVRYRLTAIDKAGNTAVRVVTMKPVRRR